MRKFLATMFLAFTLVIVGSQRNQAEAYEQYVGNYSDGTAVYLLTETISKSGLGARAVAWQCTVRAGNAYINYTFIYAVMQRSYTYENSEGYKGNVYDGSSPVAAAILNYIRNNY